MSIKGRVKNRANWVALLITEYTDDTFEVFEAISDQREDCQSFNDALDTAVDMLNKLRDISTGGEKHEAYLPEL